MPEVKICGLTNPADARASVEAGAHYVGVVFAGGPRAVTAERAREVLDAAGPGARHAGVLGKHSLDEIVGIAARAALDIVQLHADPDRRTVIDVRNATGCAVWAVLRIRDGALPQRYDEVAEEADAVVLDSYSRDQLGGTGIALQWSLLAAALASRSQPRKLVIAGGLKADNVVAAIYALHPDVVDVSSGVEQVIGRKDHDQVRAFVRTARGGVP